MEGTPAEIVAHEGVRRVYLGRPFQPVAATAVMVLVSHARTLRQTPVAGHDAAAAAGDQAAAAVQPRAVGYVESEIEQNPLLERQEDDAEPGAAPAPVEAPLERPREAALDGAPEMAPDRDSAETWSTAPDEGWTDAGDDAARMFDVSNVGPSSRGGDLDFSDDRLDLEQRRSPPGPCATI